MILVLNKNTSDELLQAACQHVDDLGLKYQVVRSGLNILIVVIGDVHNISSHVFTRIQSVEKVVKVQTKPKLVSETDNGFARFFRSGLKHIATAPGGKENLPAPIVIAGPCSVEGQMHLMSVAEAVQKAGAQMLRGGAYKPRTSAYEFAGLGQEGLEYLAYARKALDLPVVSEVMSAKQVEVAYPFVDMYQIGARNMYNYELLKEVGRTDKPILLKRAMSATIDEFLQAAEYILLEGNQQVVLCERGIRTFETHTRNTLDLSAVAVLKEMTGLPVIVDPSHGTGRRELVRPMSRAAIACGADGLIIEVHNDPDHAFSDGKQSITPDMLCQIVADLQIIHNAFNSQANFLAVN